MSEPTFGLIEALSERDKLIDGLEAEIEVRRGGAAELRDLAQKCQTVEAGEELLSKASARDADTDRLQKILDGAKAPGRSGG